MRFEIAIKSLAGAVLAVGLATSLAQAQQTKSAKPASPCKSLEQKACATKAECNWIAATKRKDGRQVKAYCRLKAKRSAAAAN